MAAATATKKSATKPKAAAKPKEPKAPRVKKAKLTNSQRRALVALAKGAVTPTTTMARQPFAYLVSQGLAKRDGGTTEEPTYAATDEGKTRASEINIEKYALKPKATKKPAAAEK